MDTRYGIHPGTDGSTERVDERPADLEPVAVCAHGIVDAQELDVVRGRHHDVATSRLDGARRHGPAGAP